MTLALPPLQPQSERSDGTSSLCGGPLSVNRLLAEVLQDEDTDRRGQIAVLAAFVDLGNQLAGGTVMRTGDVPQVTPEGILQTDARFVSVNNDRVLHDCGFHPPGS